ncbi:MAG: heparinase II/III family protein [Armatimonadetes bacterium]|nr:heparinase II/III family protein [Armatimonadota bacterium]
MHSIILSGVLIAGALFPLAAQADQPVKRARTLVTPEMAESYRQSESIRNLALKGDTRPFTAAVGSAPAQDWASKPDEWFWDIMPTTRIVRNVTVGNDPFRTPKLGCPVHGGEIYRFDAYYPWIVDCEKAPYKLKCPVGGESYPSNDFPAGDLTSGSFPDDGTGWQSQDGRYYFLGLYSHYAYNTVLQPAIKSFGRAYTITGDRRYAHKAALCLLKEAFEYPNSADRKDRTYIPGYGKESGMISDVVWSSGALVASATCYDEIFDAIEGDAELLAFAQKRVPGIRSYDDIKLYIEDNLFRPGIQAIIDKRIQPNTGWESEAMASLALLLNDFGPKRPNTADCLEWLYYGAGRLRTVGNQFYKDGSSYESSSYNDARAGYVRAGELLARLRAVAPGKVDATRYPDILRNEKLQHFYKTYKPGIQALGGAWTIAIGDVGSSGPAERRPRPNGPTQPSSYMDGYGLAVLRSGENPDMRDVALFYGGLRGHAHYDPLMLGLYGFGRDLLPNIGYPQSWNFAAAWEWSLFTHNTVVVDRVENPCSTVIGSLEVWSPGKDCQVMEARKRPYRKNEPRGRSGPDVRDYRRMVALIDVSPSVWYVVDIFRVTGGKDHMQSWHGAYTPNPIAVEGASLAPQEKGTLAGEDVTYGQRYKDASGKERHDPYCYLKDVARGRMGEAVSVDYAYDTDDSLHVRLNFVPMGDTELITARGGAPIAPDKEVLQWAIPHRAGPEDLKSQFVTVLEAYTGQRMIGAVRRLPARAAGSASYEPVALEINVPGGRDIILANGDEKGTLHGNGFSLTGTFGLIRERGGKVASMRLVEGTRLAFGQSLLRHPPADPPARITAVDRANRAITVSGRVPDPQSLKGLRIMIDNHGERIVSYQVVEARPAASGKTILTLDSSGVIGEGIAAGFEGGIIRNGPEINMAFAGLCEINGEPDYSDCFYYGGHLETGEPGVDLKVRGVMGFPYQAWGLLHNAGANHVHLCEKIPASRLKTSIGGGTEWKIYEYGVGDEVRFDRSAETQ